MQFRGKHSDVTGKILEAYFKVHKRLGYGFNEKIYERAMVIELEKLGLKIEAQKQLPVYYDDEILGEYFVDLMVNEVVIVELKATKELNEAHQAQILTYLKASKIEVGLLLNFGPETEFERKAMDNHRKGPLTWTSRNKQS